MDFIGNLGEYLGFLDGDSAEKIAQKVKRLFRSHIPMFETNQETGELMTSPDGLLVPLPNIQETHGVTIAHLQALYAATQHPISRDDLKPLLAPLYEGSKLYTQSDHIIDELT